MMFANIGNYSFFAYTYSGAKLPAAVNAVFSTGRLLLALFPLVIILSGRFKALGLKASIFLNWDILLLSSVGLASCIMVNNPIEVFTYVAWMLGLTMVVIFWITKQSELSLENKLLELAKVFTHSHFIVLILLSLKIADSRSLNFEMAYSSKNFYAYALYVLIFGIVLFVYLKNTLNERRIRIFYFVKTSYLMIFTSIALSVYFIMISGRRSALIASGLVLMTLISLTGGRSWKNLIFIFAALILLFTTPITLDGFLTIDRLKVLSFSEGQISEQHHSNSLGERLEIWSTYYTVFKSYPVFGVGPGNAQHTQAIMFPNSPVSGYSPHNSYLAVLVEYGVVGSILLFIVFVRNLYYISLMRHGPRLLYGSFSIGLLIICLFEYNSSPGQILFIPILISLIWPRFSIGKKN